MNVKNKKYENDSINYIMFYSIKRQNTKPQPTTCNKYN